MGNLCREGDRHDHHDRNRDHGSNRHNGRNCYR